MSPGLRDPVVSGGAEPPRVEVGGVSPDVGVAGGQLVNAQRPKERVFFQLGLKTETEQEIVVGKTVFSCWERSSRRHEIQIAAAACAPEMATGKGPMFSKRLFLKNTVRNNN